jgi:CTP:molybdopterin cytidylyltransferase MocA
LFPWRLAAEVGKLGDDEGLDALVARVGVTYLDFPRTAKPRDFDTPEDFKRVREDSDS